MAVTQKPRGRWASRLHFLVRFLGLTGLVAAAVGVGLAALRHLLPPWQDGRPLWENVRAAGEWGYATASENIRDVIDGLPGEAARRIIVGLVVIGGAFALLGLLVEILVLLRLAAVRRGAVRLNAVVQVALAAVLLIGVNVFSFLHYERFDWTRPNAAGEKQFTLPAKVQQQLRQLTGETTIIVYQRHKLFGTMENRDEKLDQYDSAAERKVVEKVKDLVDQFREFGTRKFRVEVLDTEEESYPDRLDALTKERPRLREAIELAPEDSVFFFDKDSGRVQSLSFNEFYQLDKAASREEKNLVLWSHGVETFADKVLNVEEKRPVVGVAVIHEVLSTAGGESDLTLAGLRKALVARGFEVRDIVLKRWGDGPPQPSALTAEDSKLDRLEDDIADYEADVPVIEKELKATEEFRNVWKTAGLAELNKKFKRIDGEQIDDDFRERQVAALDRRLDNLKDVLAETKDSLAEARKERAALDLDAAAESRRMSDVKAKLDRALAECDLVIVPRMTHYNLKMDGVIQPRLYRLSDAQVAAFRDYLKQGKPMLACFGPIGERPADAFRMGALGPAGPDGLEDLLTDLGFRFGKETILYGVEGRRSKRSQSDLLGAGTSVDVPAVSFQGETGTGRPLALRPAHERPRGPLAEAMRLTERSAGKELDLHLRHPRPVYYQPDRGRQLRPVVVLFAALPGVPFPAAIPWAALPLTAREPKEPAFEPEFMVTNRDAWNAEQPFATNGRLPRFERPKDDDKAKDTLDEPRRDSFPVGAAVEAEIPPQWEPSSAAAARTVRVAAIGHGHWFTGNDLKPAQERLLLNTCNWLLGRDEELPRAEAARKWEYPRVALADDDKLLWFWGTQAALPLLFAYLGLIVLMVRRLR
jgi:predicted  nucleic acid-binding Zn-ribbon protein